VAKAFVEHTHGLHKIAYVTSPWCPGTGEHAQWCFRDSDV